MEEEGGEAKQLPALPPLTPPLETAAAAQEVEKEKANLLLAMENERLSQLLEAVQGELALWKQAHVAQSSARGGGCGGGSSFTVREEAEAEAEESHEKKEDDEEDPRCRTEASALPPSPRGQCTATTQTAEPWPTTATIPSTMRMMMDGNGSSSSASSSSSSSSYSPAPQCNVGAEFQGSKIEDHTDDDLQRITAPSPPCPRPVGRRMESPETDSLFSFSVPRDDAAAPAAPSTASMLHETMSPLHPSAPGVAPAPAVSNSLVSLSSLPRTGTAAGRGGLEREGSPAWSAFSAPSLSQVSNMDMVVDEERFIAYAAELGHQFEELYHECIQLKDRNTALSRQVEGLVKFKTAVMKELGR